MHRPVALLAALATLLAGLVATSSTAEAAEEVSVTWPSATRLNPDSATYTITVEDPVGTGVLIAWWNETTRLGEVDGQGTTTLQLTESGDGHVLLTRCPAAHAETAYQCWSVAQSPRLSVYDHLALRSSVVRTPGLVDGVGQAHLYSFVGPDLTGATITGTWRLVEKDDPTVAVASGQTAPVYFSRPGGQGFVRIPFTVPAGLRTTRHLVVADLTVESDAYGTLTGRVPAARVDVDQIRPRIDVSGGIPILYPIVDRYLDSSRYVVRANEGVTVDLQVVDARGVVVDDRRRQARPGRPAFISWDGRVDDRPVAEGLYTLRLRAADAMNNAVAVVRTVRVSHLVRRAIVFRRSVSASASLVSKSVGRCSTLVKRGSALAFASQSRCRGDASDAVVATNHGLYIPKSFDRYGSMRVTVHGGPATRSSSDYLVFGYVRGREFTHRTVLRRGSTHRGPLVRRPTAHVFDRSTAKPYLIWSNGLAAGSRYVVRKYTVEIRYTALVRPGSKRYDAAPGTPQQTSASSRVAASYSS